MPRRSKNGRTKKEVSRQEIETLPDVETQMRRQDIDLSCDQLKEHAEAPMPITDSPSEGFAQQVKSLEGAELEALKDLVSGLNQRVAEIGDSLIALEARLETHLGQTRKAAACQSCQTELIRMSVYVHGRKIMLEYCPKCVPDPLLIMKD